MSRRFISLKCSWRLMVFDLNDILGQKFKNTSFKVFLMSVCASYHLRIHILVPDSQKSTSKMDGRLEYKLPFYFQFSPEPELNIFYYVIDTILAPLNDLIKTGRNVQYKTIFGQLVLNSKSNKFWHFREKYFFICPICFHWWRSWILS